MKKERLDSFLLQKKKKKKAQWYNRNFRTFEKSTKFNTGRKFISVLMPSNFNVIFFEALESTKISSSEPVSSQKYENGYRTKIFNFTVSCPVARRRSQESGKRWHLLQRLGDCGQLVNWSFALAHLIFGCLSIPAMANGPSTAQSSLENSSSPDHTSSLGVISEHTHEHS